MPNRSLGKVADLAAALKTSDVWAAALLGRADVTVDEQGQFDASEARTKLDQALRRRVQPELENRFTSAEMGSTPESARQWFIGQLEQHGLVIVGRAMKRGMRITVRRPNGSEFRILTYVALKEKSNGQIGFVINYMNDEGLDWIAFIAKPLGEAFLRRRKEILSKMRPKDATSKAAITFSPGTTTDLLKDRIDELVRGSK